MENWVDEYLRMVDDCEKRESRMTDWEVGFVDSIRNQLENSKVLTEKQSEKLDKIWDRVTKEG